MGSLDIPVDFHRLPGCRMAGQTLLAYDIRLKVYPENTSRKGVRAQRTATLRVAESSATTRRVAHLDPPRNRASLWSAPACPAVDLWRRRVLWRFSPSMLDV